MDTYISMLRGVNVGKNQMKMEELRALYASLGFKKVRSYVQSGNVVFRHPDGDIPQLAQDIEKNIRHRFGFEVVVFIRTKDELKRVIDNNRLSDRDATKLHVTFLSQRPVNLPLDEVTRAKDADEEFSSSDREVYLFCPNGYGRTKLSNSFFERKLKVSATTRNWRTVNTLVSMAQK